MLNSMRRVPGFGVLGMVVFVVVPGGFRSVPVTRRNMFFAQQKRSRDFTPGEITMLCYGGRGKFPGFQGPCMGVVGCPNAGSEGGSRSRLPEGG